MSSLTDLVERCPQCGNVVDQHTNRLVLESCGHQKCRNCFIAESLGCRECRQVAAVLDVDTPAVHKFQILDDIRLPPVRLHEELNETENATRPVDEAIVVEQTKEHPKATQIYGNSKKSSSSSAEPFRYPAHLQIKRTGALITFYCRICRKSFKSVNNRRYHLYCDTSIVKPLKCDLCDKRFITAGHLEYHRKIHQAPTASFPCKLCDKTFLREGSLRKHCRKEHEGNFKHACDQCGLRLQYKFELAVHKNKHEQKFPFRCHVCDKGFLLKCNLKQHIEMHSGTKAYGCDICDRRYAKKFSLKQHMLLHSNQDLQFTCTTCSKTFLTQRYLDRHNRCHYGIMRFSINSSNLSKILIYFTEKILACTLCGTKGNRKDNMQRHLKDQHPNEDHHRLMAEIIEKSASFLSLPTPTSPPPPPPKTSVNNFRSVIQFVGRPSSMLECKLIQPLATKPLSIHLRDEGHRAALPPPPPPANIQIYRKLLSPYLKPQMTEQQRSAECELSSDQQQQRPMIQNNTLSVADGNKKPVTVGKRTSEEQLAIYREILMPSIQNDDDDCGGDGSVVPTALPVASTVVVSETAAKTTSLDVLAAAAAAKESDRHFAEMHWRKRTSQCFSISQQMAKKN